MKKLIASVLVGLIFCAVANAEPQTFISVNDFNRDFNTVSYLIGSGHIINSDNINFETGTVRDYFVITFANGVIILHVYMPHIENYTGEMNDINEIDLLFSSDGTTESAAHLAIAIGELAYTTGAISDIQDIGAFADQLGFLQNVYDGASNTLTINGLNYSYSISSVFGFHFSITKAD